MGTIGKAAGETFALRDGRTMVVRPLGAADAPRLTRLIQRMSPRTLRLRFFTATRSPSARLVRRLANVDFVDRVAFAAVFPEDGELRAVGRYDRNRDRVSAEMALVVEDGLQRQGVGRELLRRLAARAHQDGIVRLTAVVLGENQGMLAFFRTSGYPVSIRLQGNTDVVTLDLRAEAGPS